VDGVSRTARRRAPQRTGTRLRECDRIPGGTSRGMSPPKPSRQAKVLNGRGATAVNVKLLLPPRQSRGTSLGGLGKLSYGRGQEIVHQTADLMGMDRAHMDHSIWRYIHLILIDAPRCRSPRRKGSGFFLMFSDAPRLTGDQLSR
jgi:hypothetical protein